MSEPVREVAHNPVFGSAPELPRTATPRERVLVLDRPPEKAGLLWRLQDLNRLALVAFVLSLVGGGVLAVVLAVVALRHIRETTEGGRRLAVAAIVLSALWTVVLVVRAVQLAG